jgi:hypothetical protein
VLQETVSSLVGTTQCVKQKITLLGVVAYQVLRKEPTMLAFLSAKASNALQTHIVHQLEKALLASVPLVWKEIPSQEENVDRKFVLALTLAKNL